MTLNPLPSQEKFPFSLPELPYTKDALNPHITESTLNYHHGKHHQAYVTNLNNLVKGTELEGKTLEEIIMLAKADSTKAGIFNNAAQIWNHTFYWHCMKPGGGGMPTGKLMDMIVRDFGSFDAFKEQFKQAGVTQFGSGWAWLVLEGDKLKITKTPNADLPMAHNQRALITMDVWEHAYYLDYQNRRPDYLAIFLDHLVNWDFANKNLNM
ncbi:MAG: superoxide dismutase [Candidatus Jidaibacter sp.]|jgi:Fe-Mn family superoxide dismutase|nr:superoxide dismutase [Candidatus Jidaibacter sp.]